jgi:hypothetical protein
MFLQTFLWEEKCAQEVGEMTQWVALELFAYSWQGLHSGSHPSSNMSGVTVDACCWPQPSTIFESPATSLPRTVKLLVNPCSLLLLKIAYEGTRALVWTCSWQPGEVRSPCSVQGFEDPEWLLLLVYMVPCSLGCFVRQHCQSSSWASGQWPGGRTGEEGS